MRIHRYLALCIEEAGRGLWFHRGLVTPALVVMIGSLTVLGAFLLVSENLNSVLATWRERGQLQVFLLPDTTAEQRTRVESELLRQEAVEDFQYISRDHAVELFRADFAELGDVLALLEDNPLPDSFAVTIRSAMRSERVLSALAAGLEAMPGVEGVQYDLQIIGRLELGVRALRFIGILLGGTVLVAAIITTANLIRVLVFSRQREIDTMRLVGASEAVVLGRFLVEGALQGLLSGLVAIVTLYTVYSVGLAYVDRGALGFLGSLPLRFLGTPWAAGLVLGGTVAGVVGAWMAFGPGGVRSEA